VWRIEAMKVQVWLWGHLSQYVPGKSKEKVRSVEVPEGSSMKDILDHLGIPGWAVDLMFLNGVYAQGSQTLKDGDRLGFFPRLLAGG